MQNARKEPLIDICCVWVGDKYTSDYVVNLYNGVKNNTAHEFRFNVITDNPTIANNIPCRVIPIPDWGDLGINIMDHRKAWWFKLFMFSPECDFHKTVLYFDLDLVIINSIDKFLEYESKMFCILQDFNRQYIPNYHVSNSSIMRFSPKRHGIDIWEQFNKNKETHIARHRGDQDFITAHFAQNKGKVWWPREWAMSWKWEIEKGGKRNNGTDRNAYYHPDKPFVIPEECSVIVCHGEPKPTDIDAVIRRKWVDF